MGAFVNDSSLGLVLFQCGDPVGKAYIDKLNQTVPAEQLGTDYAPMAGALAVATATQSCGRPVAYSFWVRIRSSVGCSVRLVCQYNGDDDVTYGLDTTGAAPTFWGEPLQLVNQSTGATASEFTGLTTGEYLFQTASAHTTGLIRWEVKSDDDPNSEDFVRIGGRAV